MPLVSHRGHCSRVTPLLASAAPFQHNVIVTQNLFWFPKACPLTSTCCSFCLKHILHLFPSQISLTLQGTELTHDLLQEAHRIDPFSTRLRASSQHPEPCGLPPSQQWFLWVCAPGDRHFQNRHVAALYRRSEISFWRKRGVLCSLGTLKRGVEIQFRVSI